MNRPISIFTAALLLLLLPLLSGCKRIPLHDPESDVYLKLEIRLNMEVQLNDDIDIDGNPELRDKVYGKMPELVRACFYDTETHELTQEFFLPPAGDFINIPAGEYDLIVYSMGTEVTRVEDTHRRGSAYAYSGRTGQMTRVTKSDEDGTDSSDSQSVIYEPDHIIVGSKSGVVIPVHAANDETIVIEMDMSTILETYSFEVRYVEGAGRIQKADVYITGQAPSKYLWDRRFSSSPATIYFPAEINEEKGHIYTVFNTFGKFPGATNKCYLNVLVTDTNGNRYRWTFDVTDQFDDPDNQNHEIIIEEQVDVPEGGGSGGFNADVEDYDTIDIYIPIN